MAQDACRAGASRPCELAQLGRAATAAEVARVFKRAQADKLTDLLETLATLGQARAVDGGRYVTV